jgi:uncharacterized protein (TIRG00374 family)
MIPGLVVSLISLAVVLHFVDINKFFMALQQANYFYVVIGLVLSFIWLVVRAAFWRTLLQEKATYSQSFFTICEGYLLNNVLPFRLGEVGRSFLMNHKAKIGFWQVLSTIVIERALDIGFAAGLLLFTLPLVITSRGQENVQVSTGVAILVGLLVLLGLIILYLMARNRQRVLRLFERLAGRWPFIMRMGGSMLPAFFDGLEVLTNGWRFLQALGWMLLNWLVAVAEYYFLLLAFVPNVKLLWSTFTLAVAAFGVALPSSPGSVGVMEGAIMIGLAPFAIFGVSASTALAFAIIIHMMNFLLNGLLGAYALGKDGESLTDLYARVRSISVKQDRT